MEVLHVEKKDADFAWLPNHIHVIMQPCVGSNPEAKSLSLCLPALERLNFKHITCSLLNELTSATTKPCAHIILPHVSPVHFLAPAVV